MTEFDLVIDHFAREIDNLPRVSQSIFFASAARVIYDDHSDAIDTLSLASVFEHAYKTITDAATDGGSRTSPFQGQVADALNAINSCSPDSLVLENSWICLDAAGRILVDSTYSSGLSVEFALQPSVGLATMEKFGVWQLGSGDQEEGQVTEVMKAKQVVRASECCSQAIAYLLSSQAKLREALHATFTILKDLTTESK